MLDPLTLAAHGPVIPVIVLQRLEHAVPLAEALLAGGVKVLEVTLRTPVALRCIEAIAKAVPQALVGAGTIRSAADARAARNAGSVFGVSPGYTTAVGAACRDAGLPLLPGVATAGEVMAAHGRWPVVAEVLSGQCCRWPAAAEGLVRAVPGRALLPDRRHHPRDRAAYLALANVPVCGGSWLTPNDAIEAGDWPRITRLAQAAARLRAGLARTGQRGADTSAASACAVGVPSPVSPATTPRRSAALRFWLTFHLASIAATSISMPTIARSMV